MKEKFSRYKKDRHKNYFLENGGKGRGGKGSVGAIDSGLLKVIGRLTAE